MSKSAEAYCDRCSDLSQAQAHGVYFGGAPDACDACGKDLAAMKYFADCEVAASGAWGYLCPHCVASKRICFGWGRGQLYQRVGNGVTGWLLVAGFGPSEG